MIIKTRKVYRCEYCGKYYLSKYHCTNHELKCRKNPSNDRPCFHCKHLDMTFAEYQNEHGEYDKVSCFVCNKKNVIMHHPTLLLKLNDAWLEDRLLGIIEETEQEEMPKECADYKGRG